MEFEIIMLNGSLVIYKPFLNVYNLNLWDRIWIEETQDFFNLP